MDYLEVVLGWFLLFYAIYLVTSVIFCFSFRFWLSDFMIEFVFNAKGSTAGLVKLFLSSFFIELLIDAISLNMPSLLSLVNLFLVKI